jgi:hypothetical protein
MGPETMLLTDAVEKVVVLVGRWLDYAVEG